MPVIVVAVDPPYQVVVGPGACDALASMMPPSARRAAVVTQEGVNVEIDTGLPTEVFFMPPGEGAKTLATVEMLCRQFAAAGLTRSDVVVAVGGGVVTDVGGYAAASWHRGTPVVHVATTLLGQIDAAIGGKTGVNLPEGKNLVGAFWQPSGVICDTDHLLSLPAAEWRSGMGEMVKYAFLGVDGLLAMDLPQQIAACVAKKAEVVAADEREGGRRMTLNYGHTLAHALEAAGWAGESGEPGLRHGEAVAIGLVFAARLAYELGRIDEERVDEHIQLVADAGLPTCLPTEVSAGGDYESIIQAMGRDKKSQGDLTFVLDGPAGVEPVRDVSPSTVAAVLAKMGGA